MAVTWKKLAYATDCVLKSLLTEQGDIIYASAPSTPAALPHGNSGQVLKSGGDGANPAWQDIGAPAAHTLNSHSVPNGAVDFDLQQATDLVVMTVANEAALPAVVANIHVGQICFATGELSLHICTEASA
jgi:hypothetical protein